MKRLDDHDTINAYCNEIPILKIISPSVKEHLSLVEFSRGENICIEGDSLSSLYFMMEGKAKVFTTQENGKLLLLCFYKDFGLLGELELLSDVPYTTTVKALSKVTCLSIDRKIFETKLLTNLDFVQFIARSLSDKLLRNTQNCTFNMLYPLENRLATYILLSAENGYFSANQTYLSELLATSLRHLTRMLSKFCVDGILEKKNSRYLILDKDKLEALTEGTINSFNLT